MNTIQPHVLVERFRERLQSGKPFSFVRMGDGEMTILRYPEYVDIAAAKEQVSRWWKQPATDEKMIRDLRAGILTACERADMLGVPHEQEQTRYPKWNVGLPFERMVQALGLPGTKTCDIFYFYHIIQLSDEGLFAEACHGKSVRVITSHPDVVAYIKAKFTPKSVSVQMLRSETFRWKAYASFDAEAERTAAVADHWPTRYNEICNWIRDGGAGHVYIIGAGGPGKMYADAAKRAGSIGLDVGALIDGWLGFDTRPYLQGLKR